AGAVQVDDLGVAHERAEPRRAPESVGDESHGGPFARLRRGRYSIPYRLRLRQSVVTLMPRRAAASSSVDDSASTCTMWRRSTSSRERPASGVAGAAGGGSSRRSGRSSARMML